MPARARFTAAALATALALSSCVTVPPEAVVLSETVGARLADMQGSHEAFLAAYFGASRDQVETFLQDRWTPEFMRRFARRSGLNALLDEPEDALTPRQEARLQRELVAAGLNSQTRDATVRAVRRSLGEDERTDILAEFTTAALEQVAAQRRELMSQIDAREREALAELRAAYAELIAMQNLVTAHLASIQDVAASQEAVLDRLRLLKTRDQALDRAVDFNERLVLLTQKADSADAVLSDLRSLLDLE